MPPLPARPTSTGIAGDAHRRRAGAARWIAADDLSVLVRAAHAGGTRELDALLRWIRPPVLAFFARRVDAAAADDLAQSVLWTVARDYRTVIPDSAAPWLVTIGRNALRDELRYRTRAAARFSRRALPLGVPTTDHIAADAEYRDLRHAVSGAAYTLCGPAVRDVVTGILDGLTVRDIADLSGASPHAIRMRLLRARATLGPVLRPILR
jgi:DNA-directed RNA polymerase specialized sigma24 family protein